MTGVCEGGSFSVRSSSLALPPEERQAFGLGISADLLPLESWARFLVRRLWSRRLTEPPRPANVGKRKVMKPAYHQKCHDGVNPPWHFCKTLQRQSLRRRGRTQLQRSPPNFQAESPMQKRTGQTPATLRERESGGEALLSEKRPLPQSFLPVVSSGVAWYDLGDEREA